jgi:predicted alpha/beta superfamily hydrolase
MLSTRFMFFVITVLTSISAFGENKDAQPFNIPRSLVVEITDPISQRIYPLFIKLPKSYHSLPNKHYPVVYLTDAWYSFQIVSGATRFPMSFNKMDEAIIVAISYSKGSIGSSSRIRDYTPTQDKQWKDVTGGAAAHRDFIEQTVFGYVESHYRGQANKRIFIGNSFGGLFGTYILLTKPEMFDCYILGSPSYWWDKGYIFELEKQFKKSTKPISAKVFIGIGELESKAHGVSEDMVNEAQAFDDLMQQWPSRLQTKLLIIPEADHQTAFPTTAIHGLQWILGKCPPKGNCLQGNIDL